MNFDLNLKSLNKNGSKYSMAAIKIFKFTVCFLISFIRTEWIKNFERCSNSTVG